MGHSPDQNPPAGCNTCRVAQRLSVQPKIPMTSFIDPVLPSMPVNVTGARELGDAACAATRERPSIYRRARTLVKFAFGLQIFTVLAALVYCLALRRGPSPWLCVLVTASVVTASLAAAEIASAILDVADAQQPLRGRGLVHH